MPELGAESLRRGEERLGVAERTGHQQGPLEGREDREIGRGVDSDAQGNIYLAGENGWSPGAPGHFVASAPGFPARLDEFLVSAE